MEQGRHLHPDVPRVPRCALFLPPLTKVLYFYYRYLAAARPLIDLVYGAEVRVHATPKDSLCLNTHDLATSTQWTELSPPIAFWSLSKQGSHSFQFVVRKVIPETVLPATIGRDYP